MLRIWLLLLSLVMSCAAEAATTTLSIIIPPPGPVGPVVSGVAETPATTTAVVTGLVSESSTVYLYYGLTAGSYSVGNVYAGGGCCGSTFTLRAPLSGLTAGTTYHFVFKATAGGVTTTTPDMTFTTE